MDIKLILMILLYGSVIESIRNDIEQGRAYVIPGENCGNINSFKVIDKLPEDPKEIAKLGCTIVKDKESYERNYLHKKPCKYIEHFYFRLLKVGLLYKVIEAGRLIIFSTHLKINRIFQNITSRS